MKQNRCSKGALLFNAKNYKQFPECQKHQRAAARTENRMINKDVCL